MSERLFGGSDVNQKTILGHPSGLFVLFFTEMWERFSYYGMRVLFVVFLVKVAFGEGAWERSDALALYGIYTGFVYFTPMIGGILADKFLGYRKAVLIGALIMTLGHASMALETEMSFYLGLLMLIIGNGFFKPNISSIVGKIYDKRPELKDGAYTIFYMGINAGAFLGILLCSYYGEQWSYSYGFGLAGIFMFIGMVQFYLAQSIFGDIGLVPTESIDTIEQQIKPEVAGGQESNVVKWGIIGSIIAVVFFALLYFTVGFQNNFLQTFTKLLMPPIIVGAVIGFVGWIVSDPTLTKVEKDRVWVIVILSFFIVFFWWAFEQAGGSMTVFALDYTERDLTGSGADIFRVINTVISVVPLIVLTYVLYKLFSVTFSEYSLSNIFLGVGFIGIWVLIIIMLREQYSSTSTEVPAGWFQVFNSLFIICLAPAFSKLWEKKVEFLNSGPVKFALGLILLGLGFAILAFGAMGIDTTPGAEVVKVSMVWLIIAYLFHTLGELCISPVGLSYVSKLAPARLVGLMFGVFFVSNFIANFAAGLTGSYIEPIAESIGLSGFFLIFAAVPISAAILIFIIKGWMKKMMHGID
jgi:POT family proton-dependent oligopeptide transporter